MAMCFHEKWTMFDYMKHKLMIILRGVSFSFGGSFRPLRFISFIRQSSRVLSRGLIYG